MAAIIIRSLQESDCCACDKPNLFYGTEATGTLLAPDADGNVYIPRPTDHPTFAWGDQTLTIDPLSNTVTIPTGYSRTQYSLPAGSNPAVQPGVATELLSFTVPVVQAGATYTEATCWEICVDIYNAFISAPIGAAGQQFYTASMQIITGTVNRGLFTTHDQAAVDSRRICEPFGVPAGATLDVPLTFQMVSDTTIAGTFFASTGTVEVKVQRTPCSVAG